VVAVVAVATTAVDLVAPAAVEVEVRASRACSIFKRQFSQLRAQQFSVAQAHRWF
jgi:hypothetical protein